MPRFPRLRREQPINAGNPVPEAKPADGKPEATKPDAKAVATPKADAKPGAKPETEGDAAPKTDAPAAEQPEAKSDKRAAKRQARLDRQRARREAAEAERKAAKTKAKPGAEPKPDGEPPSQDKPKPAAKTAGGEEPKPSQKAAERKPQKPPRERAKLAPGAKLGAAAVAGAAIAVGLLAVTGTLGSDDEQPASAPAPVISSPSSSGDTGTQSAGDLGFPVFATRNTTRVGGSDPASDAAGVALAAFPSTGGARSPIAVSLVAEDDWQTGIAASSLIAPPLAIPVLVSDSAGPPDATEQALAALKPRGGALSGGTQAFTFGEASAPDDLRERPVIGDDPAALAADIDRLRSELTGDEPGAIVITTSESPEFAMPAASYAARSGDPVLFTGSKKLPAPTARALGNHKGVPVYVLGPPSVIPDSVLSEIKDAAGAPAVRISGEDPVSNSIAFARFSDGDFGWNINDPGHGFVVARSDHPMDAAAAAPLSGSGTWGPLLLTDNTDTLPGALRGYLLDVQPGYQDDPTRALYNHVWIIGNQEAISVDQQAAIDQLAELTEIGQPKPAPSNDGDSGPTGDTGAKGATGKTGDTGSTGADGDSP